MTPMHQIDGPARLLAALPKLVGNPGPDGDVLLLALREGALEGIVAIALNCTPQQARESATAALSDATFPADQMAIVIRSHDTVGPGILPHMERTLVLEQAVMDGGYDVADALLLAADSWGDYRASCFARGPRAELDLHDPLPGTPDVTAAAATADAREAVSAAIATGGFDEIAARAPLDCVHTLKHLDGAAAADSPYAIARALVALSQPAVLDAAITTTLDGTSAGRTYLAASKHPTHPASAAALRRARDRMLGFTGDQPDQDSLAAHLRRWEQIADVAPDSHRAPALVALGHAQWASGRGIAATASAKAALRLDATLSSASMLAASIALLGVPTWMRRAA